ncbi:MAG: TonB family protein [Candidatus Sulfotelmatobacter sp.]
MPLRCLLFSSNEEMVQPIWQVLTDLGIEGEYCSSAVDAVERVTTQLFQIVITDWEDQPEATFLLKTARDQKASQRPLTLAIVSDDSRFPEALQAGANSILLKPIRPEQVRDTMNTACQLLRTKQPSPAPFTVEAPAKETTVVAAVATSASPIAPVSLPAEPEKAFRAGEFLQSQSSAPGAQFDTECEVQKSMNQVVASEVDALTELEPMAAAVESAPQSAPQPVAPRTALDGWASLQARLTRTGQAALPDSSSPEPSGQSELLAYGETPSLGSQPVPQSEDKKASRKESQDAEAEAALFSYMSRDSAESPHPTAEARLRRVQPFLVTALAVACLVLVVLPRTRGRLLTFYRQTARAGRNWLNPQPVQVPQAVTQHETFEQDSNEYKLPVATNIPDATTDPSQIRVLPVVDPTTKVKGAGADAASAQTNPGDNSATDQSQVGSTANGRPQVAETPADGQTAPAGGDLTGSTGAVSPVALPPSHAQQPPSAPQSAPAPPQPRATAVPLLVSTPPHAIPSGANAGIPLSLRSQLASTTPEASGAKPVEAAMSSIEPVNLPSSSLPGLAAQPAEPVYPDTAKASGQRGSVVLQVLIGRDGAVQDAKFLQGSLVFARAAIDAVRQWQFKPYTLNGRAVSVQSTITLNFKPPA